MAPFPATTSARTDSAEIHRTIEAVFVVAGADELDIAERDWGHDALRNSMAPSGLASVAAGTGPWIACPPGGIENMDLMLNAAQEYTLQLQEFVLA